MNVELSKLLPTLEARAEILAAYLFGSASRAAAAPRDLDLAVILRDGFEPDRFYELTLAGELERALGSALPVDGTSLVARLVGMEQLIGEPEKVR